MWSLMLCPLMPALPTQAGKPFWRNFSCNKKGQVFS
ncbi:hypothetical protein X474_16705 [Dethiosulfatarculus sandiegensis]|uniref:Uncharacterized protein n=1 Tax=Dethiosulfatarculus sandiegensis TaxID=1429043 RepID=A0A0D2JTW7_9BACT|nr:hypothetical protein X474_16705 [Dethiosulfatarculus sandiegensis]